MLMGLAVWIIGGIIAGWLTGLILKGKGFGLFGDLVIGLLGGLLGGWLAGQLGIDTSGLVRQVIISVIGGVILVALVRGLLR
jgi:uncharacterized membrane protein YeaQ/YmgE (transglycosylase-associated protein family)